MLNQYTWQDTDLKLRVTGFRLAGRPCQKRQHGLAHFCHPRNQFGFSSIWVLKLEKNSSSNLHSTKTNEYQKHKMRCLLTASCSLREFDFARSGGSLGRQISYCEGKKKFRIIVLTILSGLNLTLVFLNLKRGPVLRALGPDFQYWGLGKEQQSLWSQHLPDQSHCPLRTWPKPQNKLNKLLIFQKVVER